MASRRLLVALMVAAVLLSGAAHVTAATWGVSVQGSMDIPDRELETKYGTYTVSEFKRVDKGETITVDAEGPSGEFYFVRLVNADGGQEDSGGSNEGSKSFDFPMDYDPGTYVFAQMNKSSDPDNVKVYDVAPVVVRGYAVELEAPSEASAGEGMSATVTIDEVADSPDPREVTVVVGDDSETVEAPAEGPGDEYEATVSLDEIDAGDYTAYAVVEGEMTNSGERNILGVSDTHAVSVTEESSGGTGGGGGGGGPTGSSGTAPASTSGNETTTPGNETATATPAASPTDTLEGAETTIETDADGESGESGAAADESTATPDLDADRETATESPTAEPTPTESTPEPTASTGTTVPVFGPLGTALLALAAVAFVVSVRRRA